LIGAALLVLSLARPIYGYFHRAYLGGLRFPTASSWVLVTIAIIIFGFPYSYTVDLIALVAMGNSVICASQKASVIILKQQIIRPPRNIGQFE
jgi:hypothetical protein